jgi:hypothetical protein
LTARDVGDPPVPDGPSPPAAKSDSLSAHRTKVFLHVGEPKTGTTFVQQAMWGNRAELAARGVLLPGHHPQDHFRASQDLRDLLRLPADPAPPWTGEWDVLAGEAKRAPVAAVISHELFAALDAGQVERAVSSLLPADVHVILTIRDMGTLLPAEWQETVKHRNTKPWEDWLVDVIDLESAEQDRRRYWFWRVHDSLAILDLWSQHLPADNLHVIINPPRGSAPDLLWRRFASVLGIDASTIDLSRARANSSLGVAETEFLRRLNEVLPPDVPNWFYMRNVKEVLAHRALAERPRGSRLVLPPARDAWAAEQGDILIAGLRDSKYDVVGDLEELRPYPAPGPWPSPAAQPLDEVLDIAVQAAGALVANHYRKVFVTAKPQRDRGEMPGLAGRIEWTFGSSLRIKRALRSLSSRYRAARRLRVLVWQLLERQWGRRQR